MVTPKASCCGYISSDHIFSEYCRKILFLCLEKKSPPDLNVHNGIDLLIYRCFRTVAVDCGIQKPNNNYKKGCEGLIFVVELSLFSSAYFKKMKKYAVFIYSFARFFSHITPKKLQTRNQIEPNIQTRWCAKCSNVRRADSAYTHNNPRPPTDSRHPRKSCTTIRRQQHILSF